MNIFINSLLRFLTFSYHFCFERFALDVSLNVIKVDFFSFLGRCDFHCNIFAFICKKNSPEGKTTSKCCCFQNYSFQYWGFRVGSRSTSCLAASGRKIQRSFRNAVLVLRPTLVCRSLVWNVSNYEKFRCFSPSIFSFRFSCAITVAYF